MIAMALGPSNQVKALSLEGSVDPGRGGPGASGDGTIYYGMSVQLLSAAPVQKALQTCG